MTDEVLRGSIWPLGLQATKIFVWSEGFDELSVCKKTTVFISQCHVGNIQGMDCQDV